MSSSSLYACSPVAIPLVIEEPDSVAAEHAQQSPAPAPFEESSSSIPLQPSLSGAAAEVLNCDASGDVDPQPVSLPARNPSEQSCAATPARPESLSAQAAMVDEDASSEATHAQHALPPPTSFESDRSTIPHTRSQSANNTASDSDDYHSYNHSGPHHIPAMQSLTTSVTTPGQIHDMTHSLTPPSYLQPGTSASSLYPPTVPGDESHSLALAPPSMSTSGYALSAYSTRSRVSMHPPHFNSLPANTIGLPTDIRSPVSYHTTSDIQIPNQCYYTDSQPSSVVSFSDITYAGQHLVGRLHPEPRIEMSESSSESIASLQHTEPGPQARQQTVGALPQAVTPQEGTAPLLPPSPPDLGSCDVQDHATPRTDSHSGQEISPETEFPYGAWVDSAAGSTAVQLVLALESGKLRRAPGIRSKGVKEVFHTIVSEQSIISVVFMGLLLTV